MTTDAGSTATTAPGGARRLAGRLRAVARLDQLGGPRPCRREMRPGRALAAFGEGAAAALPHEEQREGLVRVGEGAYGLEGVARGGGRHLVGAELPADLGH